MFFLLSLLIFERVGERVHELGRGRKRERERGRARERQKIPSGA